MCYTRVFLQKISFLRQRQKEPEPEEKKTRRPKEVVKIFSFQYN